RFRQNFQQIFFFEGINKSCPGQAPGIEPKYPLDGLRDRSGHCSRSAADSWIGVLFDTGSSTEKRHTKLIWTHRTEIDPEPLDQFAVHLCDTDFEHDLLHATDLHRIDDFLRRIGFSNA